MKRFLSITLCVMMIASLFAVNVSAAIPTTYEVLEGAEDEIIYFNQDFSDATKTDFTERQYEGAISVDEAGVMHMTGGYKTGASMSTTATTAIGSGEYVFEFDFMRNDDLQADYQIFVTFQRAANASSSNANLKKYGVIIPVRTTGMVTVEDVNYEDSTNADVDIEAKKWYNFRITVSESAFVEAGGTEDKTDLVELMTVERKLATESDWTELTYTTGGNNFPANQCRIYGSNATAWQNTNEVNLGVKADAYGQKLEVKGYTFDEATSTYVEGSTVIASEDGTKADFQFDNIKCYVPAVAGEEVEYPLPINQGVVYTDLTEKSATSAGTTVNHYSKTIGWAAEPTKIVTTFDAVCTVAGGPLSFSTAGLVAKSAMATIAPGTIGQWYNYKIVYSSNGTAVTADAVYRKAEGTNNWTLLTKGADKSAVTDGQWCVGYNSSSSLNAVRWYMYGGETGANATSNCTAGTSWTVKNIQVTDGSAFTGKATAANGNLTVALNTELWSAADVIVAVYDGTKLANVSYAPVAITGNTATVTVPYATGNTVKLYAWDGIGTGVPVLAEPMTINVAQ